MCGSQRATEEREDSPRRRAHRLDGQPAHQGRQRRCSASIAFPLMISAAPALQVSGSQRTKDVRDDSQRRALFFSVIHATTSARRQQPEDSGDDDLRRQRTIPPDGLDDPPRRVLYLHFGSGCVHPYVSGRSQRATDKSFGVELTDSAATSLHFDLCCDRSSSLGLPARYGRQTTHASGALQIDLRFARPYRIGRWPMRHHGRRRRFSASGVLRLE